MTTFPETAIPFKAPKWLSVLAQIVSYIFHPLFVPFAVAWLLLYQHPINLITIDDPMRLRLIAMIFINTILFPAFMVFLLWRLKFISNVYLETQRERIIPLIISIIFYFWGFYVSKNIEIVPLALQQWLLGIFLTSCIAMLANIFMKISLHTLGLGGAVMFFLLQMKSDPHWPAAWIFPVLLMAGAVGSARLLRTAHQPSEIYVGYMGGAICQIAAFFIL